MFMKFEWEDEIDRINREKHGISFETASYVFQDKYYIEMYDFEHSMDEVKTAAKREVQFDEDAPELSPAMFKAFQCSVSQRNRRKENA